MKKNLNANSKRIAGTTGATSLEAINLKGTVYQGIVLHESKQSSIGPATWYRVQLVYLPNEGKLLKVFREVHIDCNPDCFYDRITCWRRVANNVSMDLTQEFLNNK